MAQQKWVKAVNHHGGFGRWELMLCKEPTKLGTLLDAYTWASSDLVPVELSAREMKRLLELNTAPPAPTEALVTAWNRQPR